MAWISIYGLTLLTTDDIFSELELPTQFAGEEDVITDRLLLDTMELEVLYPDPAVFKGALGIYSKSRLPSWQKLADDMYHAYDPFINFTRDEVRGTTITRDLQDKRTDDLTNLRTANLQDQRTANLQDQRTANLTDTKTLNLANGNTRDTKRNAWDGSTAGTMIPAEQTTDSGSNTGTDTDTHTGTDTVNTTGTDTHNTTGTDTIKNTGTQIMENTGTLKTEEYFHSQGDSAMYTPTDVAEKEWKLRAQYSVIEYIIADIKTHFCLMVY